jgi:GH25 family lysozyme M1 (1,4-beta-N-acetylmuramidase)
MDSRLRRLALLGSLGVITLVALVVLYANGAFDPPKQPVAAPVEETEEPEEVLPKGQIGNNLYGYLQDNTFFDEEKNAILEQAMDQSNRLSLMITSVEKDLRVQVVDVDGKLVPGIKFIVRLSDSSGQSSDYKDLDRDGVIYAGQLSPGDYNVELMPVEGFKVPSNPTTVRVKDKVEYVAIDDISLLIKTEADIDAEAEDTAEADALADADKTEIVKLQAGGVHSKAGIDVSKWQGDIDWTAVKNAGVEFAIIRCGYRGSQTGTLVEDPYFAANIRGAQAAGIEVGVYFFTQAVTEAEAVEEASAALMLVQEYELNLPIYIDTEGAGGNGRADGLDKDTRTLVCEAFCRTVVNAGRQAGVYASRNWLNKNLNVSRLSSFETWLAEYRSIPQYEGYYTMWQYTSKGSVDGIKGRVDLDLYYY